MKNELLQKYDKEIKGTLSCYDRVLLRGTLPRAQYSGAMKSLLYEKGVQLKDITKFTSPLKDELRLNAQRIADSAGLEIEFIKNNKRVRKDDLVKERIRKEKLTSGLVHILSAMESCVSFKFYYNAKGLPDLKMSKGRCLHYYFYYIDEELGLCYLRVPTWAPFQLQFYFNAHNWLAIQLDKAGIDYELKANAFTAISDYEKAQAISDSFEVKKLHKILDKYAEQCCSVYNKINHTGYQWSIRQIEYATDIIFKNKTTLGPIYDHLLKQMMHTVTPDDVARFLGSKKVEPSNKREIDTSYKQVIREEMRRIKHRMGESSIKIYDKFSQILRIETTTYNTTNFKHYRRVDHRNGSNSSRIASVKKSIYSIKPLRKILFDCNKRYLDYIAAFEVPLKGKKRLNNLTKNKKVNNRNYKGFNLFDREDEQLLKAIAQGKFIINGFRNKDIKKQLKNKNTSKVSRLIKRLRVKGIIKKVKNTYRYYLTTLGQKIIASALNVKEHFLVQQMNY